jgi:hypothetical protein|tara:strand:+ start:1225 stop:1581 length:357 start_codon:yes stop_codon:yes gene_type:complete
MKEVVGSKDVEKWIRRQVIKTNNKDRKTILPFETTNKKIQVIPAKDNMLVQVNQCCDLFSILHFDIVILYFNYKISEKKLSTICEQAQKNNPHYKIIYSFNFQKAPLLFIHSLNTLGY